MAWRLHRHQLDRRRTGASPQELAERLCGIHAQVLSSAELALAIRVEGADRQSIRADLLERRALVKTWAMRGTLHLLSSRAHPFLTAALTVNHEYWSADGLTPAEQDVHQVTDVVGPLLRGRCLTRAELAAEVGGELGRPDLEAALNHGFGPLLKPAALSGQLCFGPPRGRQVTFMHPADWAPQPWQAAQPDAAAAQGDLLRAFLGGYGPTPPADIARWWGGLKVGHLNNIRRQIEQEILTVEVEGRRCWMLREDFEAVSQLPPSRTIRMLGGFDPYTVTLPRGVEHLLPKAARPLVYRTAGWISPVVTAGATVVGTWRPPERPDAPLPIELLRPLTAGERNELEEQTQLICGLLNTSAGCTVRPANGAAAD